jgi:2-polyprenyl-3-methyl-5-hydroxy-6-metoxy-1,4-benzoquinol methylase
MDVVKRMLSIVSSGLKSYGPSSIKRFLWNKEYSSDKWNFADNTVGDCVYAHLEKHAACGSILDLGCGTGNTATELAVNAYRDYTGVDISETCLSKAERRTKETGRTARNHFVRGDFISYAPTQPYDVILFRESLYHVPPGKIKSTLDHYASYLKAGGVFIVRMKTSGPDGQRKSRPLMMLDVIKSEFDVVENCDYREAGSTVIVFRPRSAERAASKTLAG